MEQHVFPKPEVVRALGEFVTVSVFVDSVPIDSITATQRTELGEKNAVRELDMLNTNSIPYYVVITPDGKVIDTVAGFNEAPVFADFLKKALAKTKDERMTEVKTNSRKVTSADPEDVVRKERKFAGVPWGLSYTAALERAKTEKKPVLAYFTSLWDQNSRLLETRILPEPDVSRQITEFVPVWLDISRVSIQALDVKDQDLLGKKNQSLELDLINRPVTPCLVAIRPDGSVIDSLCGYAEPTAMAKFLIEAKGKSKLEPKVAL